MSVRFVTLTRISKISAWCLKLVHSARSMTTRTASRRLRHQVRIVPRYPYRNRRDAGQRRRAPAAHRRRAADIVQPDAPRIGGITQFLKLATIAESKQLEIAPHFAMEIHCHLAAAYPIEPWVEHFDWLDPLFNQHLETRDGRMWVSDRPGLGFTLSEQANAWTIGTAEYGSRP